MMVTRTELSNEERREIIGLLHGAIARHHSPTGRNEMAAVWHGLLRKIEGAAVLVVERS